MLLVILYLGAVISANLVIAAFGPAAVVPVSFFLVGFTLVARDRLHEVWEDRLAVNMGLLILAGGVISAVLNLEALPIAIASMAAFLVAESADAIVYHPLYKRGFNWLARSNASNVVGAILDSFIFVTLAFGFAPEIIAAQIAAKIGGGLFWSIARSAFAVGTSEEAI